MNSQTQVIEGRVVPVLTWGVSALTTCCHRAPPAGWLNATEACAHGSGGQRSEPGVGRAPPETCGDRPSWPLLAAGAAGLGVPWLAQASLLPLLSFPVSLEAHGARGVRGPPTPAQPPLECLHRHCAKCCSRAEALG